MVKKLIFIFIIFFVFNCKTKNSLNSNWIEIKTENQSFISDIAFSSSSNGLITGYTWYEKGFFPNVDIFRTFDGGDSWTLLKVKYTGKLNYSYFQNISGVGENIYFVSNGSELFKTTDGGLVWNYVGESLINKTGDILFLNENIGITVGQGNINITNDGAKNWEIVYKYNSETLNKNNDNILRNNNNLYIFGGKYFDKADNVANYSGIIKGSNGGTSWNLERTPFSQVLDLFYVNDKIGFTISTDNFLFKTINSGKNWEKIAFVKGYKIYFVNENEGYIFEEGKINYSNDGGKTWILEFENKNLKGIKKVISLDNSSISAFLSNGGLLFKKKYL